jgi:hypothetical protein
VADAFHRNDAWMVPTLTMIMWANFYAGTPMYREEVAGAKPFYRRLDQYTRAFFAGASLHQGNWLRDSMAGMPLGVDGTGTSRGLLSLIQHVGMPILAGTDQAVTWILPGASLHAELAMYVAEGMTSLNALQSATINPAKFLHGIDSLGTVAEGKLADLVLLDADPLADITNTTTIRAVVANGRYFDRTALNKLTVDAQDAFQWVDTTTSPFLGLRSPSSELYGQP